jgi:uncharacterized membrane protein
MIALPFCIGGLMIFQATNQMLVSNLLAILQGLLTWPIAASIGYGIAMSTSEPIYFVLTSCLNTTLAGTIITIISNVYMRRYLGKLRLHLHVGNVNKTLVVPINAHKRSYAQRKLDDHETTSIEYLGYERGHVVITLK